jgi:phosphate transport system protein
MNGHFQKEIDKLKKQLLSLGTLVEENLFRAIQAVESLDAKLAQDVMDSDDRIDQMDVEIEEECLKILALYQPVATDLRYIVAALKINNDLERISDLAVNIAKRVPRIRALGVERNMVDFGAMSDRVRNQFRKALDSFVYMDSQLATVVCVNDENIDILNKDMHNAIAQQVKDQSATIELMMLNLAISKNLERIADHAKNIAEDVIYLVQGKIVRHTFES